MRVGFLTLGCKVNAYETEKMKLQFEQAGYSVVAFEEKADVYIINTCTVTNIADRKSRKMLHRARRSNPDAVVAAVGCYVDSAKKRGETDDSIDLLISNQEKAELVEKVNEMLAGKGLIGNKEEAFVSERALAKKHTRAYLKVQDGCNQFCTYCIIPYVRGPLKSKKESEVVREVKALAAEGVKEVVVTGIHLSSYGVDLTDKKSFLELEGRPLLALLAAIAGVEGIERIRLGSLEPRIITGEFVKELAANPKICPHFHLSLQSGCDETLRRMNRHYTTADYLSRIQVLRDYFEHPAITTDVIVGFPQETEQEFERTCDFVRQVGFSQIHVFKYSRRHGTMADAMDGQIDESVKAARSDKLLAIEQELETAYQQHMAGQKEKVLFEEIVTIRGKAYLVGYNERYVRIAVNAEQIPDAEKSCNTIGTVRILGNLTQEILLGEPD